MLRPTCPRSEFRFCAHCLVAVLRGSVTDCEMVFLLLKDLAVSCLRETEIHHLVHQLVHSHKVVTNAFLLKLLEVLLKNLHMETRIVCSGGVTIH